MDSTFAPALIAVGSTGNSREIGRAAWGGGEARSTDKAVTAPVLDSTPDYTHLPRA
jgi:hypothetical protein